MAYKYVFGPVSSGRLGLSLGLDLLGDAVCSLDCIYCEAGKTKNLTTKRQPYVDTDEILSELAKWKEEAARLPEVVTLGGMGEPCLNSGLGEIIEGVRKIFPTTPVAVLTNSTLFADPAVRRELAKADRVLPSLDTLVDEEMRRVNRPQKDVTVQAVRDGLLAFREQFAGRIYLEILLVAGVNDSDENLGLLREFIPQLKPDRVDVVTMTRPGVLEQARPVDTDTLAAWQNALSALAVDGGKREQRSESPGANNFLSDATVTAKEARERVAASITRRPQSAAQLAQALGLPSKSVQKALQQLHEAGRTRSFDTGGVTFHAIR